MFFRSQISSMLSKIHSNLMQNFSFTFRSFAGKSPKVEKHQSCCADPSKCPNTTCQKQKTEKRWFWSRFFGKSKNDEPPPIESCRVRQSVCKNPDLSEFEGTPYRTCGPAYIVVKDLLPSHPCTVSAEVQAIKKMEANLGMKDKVFDPMPNFTSAEQRLVDLSNKRLHPCYRRYMNVPRRRKSSSMHYVYKSRKGGPILPHEIPGNLKFNRELLEKKNLFADYKRVEPPRQLVASMIEMKKNARPTMEYRMPVVPSDAQQSNQKKTIADTLYQKEHKF